MRFLISILFLFFISSNPIIADSLYTAAQGELDLSRVHFSQEGIQELNGEWEFYWGQHLDPDFFVQNPSFPRSYTEVPGIWEDPNEGIATYRLRLHLDQSEIHSSKALYMPSIATTYRLFLNGQLYSIDESDNDSFTDTPRIIPFEPDTRYVEIVIQVSNYEQRKGGIWKCILFGDADDILKVRDKKISFELFIIGSLLVMGLYHISLFLVRRTEKSAFYFGLFCLLMIMRTVVVGEIVWMQWFPQWPWEWAVKMEYLSITFGIPFFALYVKHLFPEETSKYFTSITLTIGLAFGLLVVSTSARFYTHFMLTIQIWILLTFLVIILIYLKGAIRKKPGSYVNLLGIFVFFMSLLHDTLYYNQVISGDDLAPFGLFLYLFSQSVILVRNFSHSFTKIERLSDELTLLNQTLETKVRDRTLALEESKAHLEKVNDELFRMESSRRNLLSNLSHDLKTPMSSIQGYIKAIIDGVIKPDDQKHLYMIYSKTHFMNRLFDDLLDLAKLESGQVKFKKEPHEFCSFIRHLYQKYEFDIWENEIQSEFVSLLPDNKVYGNLDSTRIEQVFSNLILNSIKYTEKGGKITVSLSYFESEQPYIKVMISDTGIGITEEALPFVFDRYYRDRHEQVHNTSGSGLGLAISKEIIERHGGEMGVNSKLHQGSTFYFTLPVINEEDIDVAK